MPLLFGGKAAIAHRPWQLESIRFTGKQLNTTTLGGTANLKGAQFNDVGSKMLAVGATTGIHEYNLSKSWDILSASYQGKYDPQLTYNGEVWKEDGSKIIVIDDAGAPVYFREYNPSTNWVTSSGVSAGNVSSDISGDTDPPSGLEMNPTGTRLYTCDLASPDSIDQYTLGTAYNVTTASYQKRFDVSAQTGGPNGPVFRRDNGLQFWIWNAQQIYQYNANTAWDVGGASYDKVIDLSSVLTGSITGIRFDVTGTRVLITTRTPDLVWEFRT